MTKSRAGVTGIIAIFSVLVREVTSEGMTFE
jgi:hypothetical protein